MTPDEPPSAGVPGTGLQPPGTQPPPLESKRGLQGLIWAALAVVVLLGLGVLLVLPKMVSGPLEGSADVKPTPVAAEPAPATLADSAGSQEDAQQALQEFLHTRARLELANVMVWGEPEWSQAIQGAEEGNDHFSQRRFSMATAAFEAASGLLHLLESERGPRLAAALDSGWRALHSDDSVAAIGFFETAKAIDKGSLDALDGLERARVRPELLQLMTAGDMARTNKDLAGAQAVYLEAVTLDGAYEPAAAALQEVSGEIDDIAFRDAMSRAISALESEQVEIAEAALRQAAELKPDEQVVRNTRQELAQTRQRLWLEAQRKAASSAASEENWTTAVAIYRKVLARTPQMGFARQGLEVAEDRERLHQQLDHYLQDPSRVYAEQPRANAEKLLASSSNPPVAEPRLTEKVQRLQVMITEAKTPRMVTLNSDGLTSVQIYHIGRLGQFTSQQVELRPGTYTVVGSRPGYRDTRKTLTVKPGPKQQTLDIRCEETV